MTNGNINYIDGTYGGSTVSIAEGNGTMEMVIFNDGPGHIKASYADGKPKIEGKFKGNLFLDNHANFAKLDNIYRTVKKESEGVAA